MKSINLQGDLLTFDEPKVMGILNVTADSFFDGSLYNTTKSALKQTQVMVDEGADIVDIGAASSRPGAISKTATEEWNDLEPVLKEIRNQFPNLLISIDTYHGKVAEKAINAGANIINDISAYEMDPFMFDVIKESKVPYILMHMKGKPSTMQENPNYDNITSEILKFFTNKLHQLRSAGLTDLMVDPGFGFGKTLAHNYQLFNHLGVFKMLECPILVGVSRKSMIYQLLDISAAESLSATSALHLQALRNGADLLRVHDVKEARQVIELYKALEKHN